MSQARQLATRRLKAGIKDLIGPRAYRAESYATHTAKEPAYVRRNPARDIALPLVHPPAVERDVAADRAIQRHVIGLTHWRCLRRGLRRALGEKT
jgi:hypothetical protein